MKKNALQQEDLVSKEMALQEIHDFVEKYNYESKKADELEEEYPQVLKAIQKGLLVFKDGKPFYTLLVPILTDAGAKDLETVEFRTRLKPSQLAAITKGLNVAKQQMEYTLRCLSYIIKKEKVYLDKFDKFDYKVIEQVATVFF